MTLPDSEIYNQFKRDMSGVLANLFKYCLAERKHLKTKKGQAEAEAIPVNVIDADKRFMDVCAYVLMFSQMRWANISLAEKPPEKLSDNTLLDFIKRVTSEEQDLDDTAKLAPLGAKEKKVLKELALRLS